MVFGDDLQADYQGSEGKFQWGRLFCTVVVLFVLSGVLDSFDVPVYHVLCADITSIVYDHHIMLTFDIYQLLQIPIYHLPTELLLSYYRSFLESFGLENTESGMSVLFTLCFTKAVFGLLCYFILWFKMYYPRDVDASDVKKEMNNTNNIKTIQSSKCDQYSRNKNLDYFSNRKSQFLANADLFCSAHNVNEYII